MREATIVEEWIAEAVQVASVEASQKGFQQGLQQGEQQGRRTMLLNLLEGRFGRLSPSLVRRLNVLPVESIEYLFDAAIHAESLAAVEAELSEIEAGQV